MVLTGHHSRDPLFQWRIFPVSFFFSASPPLVRLSHIKQFGSLSSPPKPKPSFGKLLGTAQTTLDVIQMFNPHLTLSPNSCSCCRSDLLLFLHSLFTWRLWGRLFQLVNLSWVVPWKILLFMSRCKSMSPCKSSRKLWIFCLQLACEWCWWNAANEFLIIFRGIFLLFGIFFISCSELV